MATVTYRIVEHNGGYAYRVGDVFSETFETRDLARAAAKRAAAEQRLGGEDTDIEYEDENSVWRTESASGGDRPETEVKG